jgi:hypothetical protein
MVGGSFRPGCLPTAKQKKRALFVVGKEGRGEEGRGVERFSTMVNDPLTESNDPLKKINKTLATIFVTTQCVRHSTRAWVATHCVIAAALEAHLELVAGA